VESALQSGAPVFRVALVRVGAFALLFACLLPSVGPSFPDEVRSISVAETRDRAAVDAESPLPARVRDVSRAEVVLGAESAPLATLDAAPAQTSAPAAEPTPAPTVVPAATLPSLSEPATGGIVVASWYGPGFYGNRTACGQIYTPEIVGVAHRTLRCGTLVVLEYRGRTTTVPVIDRGPYIAGRTLDLSNATRIAMGCPDLCTLSMRIGQ
jgi:rare lipoprotein A (peptidoglycan hydrolase)